MRKKALTQLTALKGGVVCNVREVAGSCEVTSSLNLGSRKRSRKQGQARNLKFCLR